MPRKGKKTRGKRPKRGSKSKSRSRSKSKSKSRSRSGSKSRTQQQKIYKKLEEMSPYNINLLGKGKKAKSSQEFIEMFSEYKPSKDLRHYMNDNVPFLSLNQPASNYGMLTRSSPSGVNLSSNVPELARLLDLNEQLSSLIDEANDGGKFINITEDRVAPVIGDDTKSSQAGGVNISQMLQGLLSGFNFAKVPKQKPKTLDQLTYTARPDTDGQRRRLARSDFMIINDSKEGIDPSRDYLFVKPT